MGQDDNWSLLGRLRGAVKKIRVLLNFDINRWKLASLIGGASSGRKRLSFNDRPGLRSFVKDSDSNDSGSGRALQRTTSCPSDQEDIDKRAEMFIANFYKQLKMERQISLDLRYARDSVNLQIKEMEDNCRVLDEKYKVGFVDGVLIFIERISIVGRNQALEPKRGRESRFQ